MKFRERMGIIEVEHVIQTNGMDSALRNSLWNILHEKVWVNLNFYAKSRMNFEYTWTDDAYQLAKQLWMNYFKNPLDEMPNTGYAFVKTIKTYYYKVEWGEAYEFLEFILGYFKIDALNNAVNVILKRELSGFRYANGGFIPITEPEELQSITDASNVSISGVRQHIKQAIAHLANRKDPDYRNSIKESISAVEAAVREVTGNASADLSDGLAFLERKGKIHGAMKKAFGALYGYTSDSDGIRHAIMAESNLGADDAIYFLVICSAFVNYLMSK